MKTFFESLSNYKTTVIAIAIIAYGIGCCLYGSYIERLEANEEIALLEKDYAARESSALCAAENIRKQQEQKYLAEMDNLKRINSELTADALRVREQFDQLKSRRSPDLERSNNRTQRCEQLLSEAYSLAGEGEGLLKDRDARLNALK